MGWIVRFVGLAALAVIGYYAIGLLIAAVVGVLLVWFLLASESAILGD